MSAPDTLDPSNPEPSPEATLRLPAGLPVDPRSTVQVDIPRLLSSQSTQKLLRPEPAADPNLTQRLKGGEPPIRRQKVDHPLEAEGQTQNLSLQPQASRPLGWKLPLGLVVLVAVGVVTYVVMSRIPSRTPVVPPAAGATTGAAEAVPSAAKVYLQQAKTGDTHAMRMLGAMYYNGLDVPKDRGKGLYWYRLAAEKGSDAARSELDKIEGGR